MELTSDNNVGTDSHTGDSIALNSKEGEKVVVSTKKKIKNMPNLPDVYSLDLDDPLAPPTGAVGEATSTVGSLENNDERAVIAHAPTATESATVIDESESEVLTLQEKTRQLEERFDGKVPSVHRGFPTGEDRGTRFGVTEHNEMDITFIGTASCAPSLNRGVSCMAFRYNQNLWLFDVGESSQLQIQRSRIRASKVKKIFITHNHGDHVFGLPGILCMFGQSQAQIRMNNDYQDDEEPVEIYGPEGIRSLIRASMQLTYSRIAMPYRVHELKDVPFLHDQFSWKPRLANVQTSFLPKYGEREGGKDIYPDEKGHYHLFDDGEFSVKAAPMQHTVPCVGYVVTERDRPGRLMAEEIKPHVMRNWKALEAAGLKPHKVYPEIKDMASDDVYTFPDGTKLRAGDVNEPKRQGRKVVYMGDTCSGRAIAELSKDADLVVHEATNAFFQSTAGRHKGYRHLERDTIKHGHSTPEMAGRFAKAVNAKRLILNHFSSRYYGDWSENSMRVMWGIEDMARRASGLWGENGVVAAWDGMSLPVLKYDASGEAIVKKKSQAMPRLSVRERRQFSDPREMEEYRMRIAKDGGDDSGSDITSEEVGAGVGAAAAAAATSGGAIDEEAAEELGDGEAPTLDGDGKELDNLYAVNAMRPLQYFSKADEPSADEPVKLFEFVENGEMKASADDSLAEYKYEHETEAPAQAQAQARGEGLEAVPAPASAPALDEPFVVRVDSVDSGDSVERDGDGI
jgi:ribonuclease Z